MRSISRNFREIDFTKKHMWSVEDFVEYCHEDEAKWRIMYLKAWKHNTIQYYTKWYDKDDLWFLWDIFVGKAEAFVNYLFSHVFFIVLGFFIFIIINLEMCRYYRLGNLFSKYVYFFKPISNIFFLFRFLLQNSKTSCVEIQK